MCPSERPPLSEHILIPQAEEGATRGAASGGGHAGGSERHCSVHFNMASACVAVALGSVVTPPLQLSTLPVSPMSF